MILTILQNLPQFILLLGSIKSSSFLKPLSKMEEHKYLIEKTNGNKEARDKLIEHNLRLVAHIVKKYDLHKETQDLISIGTIGLIKAIDTYDINKGKKLTTYASRCIENEILMHLRSNKNNYTTLSLDDTIISDKDGTNTTLLDTICCKEETSISEKITLEQEKAKLLKCLKVLDAKEKEIIEKRYGLNGEIEHKQKEIAKILNISRSYVSRIEKRALLKLYRAYINS